MTTEATRVGQDSTEAKTLYMAMELSQKSWRLGFATAMTQRPRERTIKAGDLARLSLEIKATCERFGLGPGCRVASCYEAGRDGFWLHRYLLGIGVDNRVVDSSSIEVNRRARQAKTDHLDVGRLLRLLIRYQNGERGVWSVLRVPSHEDEDARHLHRELSILKKDRTREINRIKGLLANQGIVLEKRGKIDIDLDRARTGDDKALGPGLRGRIRRCQQRIKQLQAQIEELEKERIEELMHSPRPEARKARMLNMLKGIGPHTATVMVKEVGWRKIKNGKQLGALAGLTPTPFQSGTSAREQGISKAGNAHLRVRMIETAWLWLRYQPGSALSQWYFKRFADGGARQRRVGIVALARKLLIALWRYMETGELPQGAVTKA